MDNEQLKRNDQIRLLEAVLEYTDEGKEIGLFTYPNCGCDLVKQGLATEDKKITKSGRVALWLLGKCADQTSSKAVEVFKFPLRDSSTISHP